MSKKETSWQIIKRKIADTSKLNEDPIKATRTATNVFMALGKNGSLTDFDKSTLAFNADLDVRKLIYVDIEPGLGTDTKKWDNEL